jgi:transcriptional regulator with PAS, ATPase and Fis domain
MEVKRMVNESTKRNAVEDYTQLELVAYGCNRRVYKKLEEKLDELCVHSFTFCEYFPVEPVYLLDEPKSCSKSKFLFPFARRYSLRPVFPDKVDIRLIGEKDKDGETVKSWWERITAELRLKENIAKFYEPLEIEMPLTAQGDYKLPFDTPHLIDKLRETIKSGKKLHSQEPREVVSAEEISYSDPKGTEEFVKYLIYAEVSLDGERIKKEWLTMDREWWWYLQGGQRTVIYIYIPVASNYYLYGVLQLTVAMEKFITPIAPMKEKEIKEIVDTLWEIAKEDYLPLLIIFHNFRKEKKLKEALREKVDFKNKVNTARNNWLSNSINEEDLTPLEKVFKKMWDYRTNLGGEVDNLKEKVKKLQKDMESKSESEKKKTKDEIENCEIQIEEKIKYLEESLIMPDYLVASPGMIKQLQTALTLSLQATGKYIPSVLIVGGSGAGKELMAKLIAHYSEDFRDALYKPFNLAEGFYAHEPGASKKLVKRLKEIFIEAQNKNANSVVLVFDELNSLPLEVQGTLLRIIENKEELTTLLSTTNKTINPEQLEAVSNYIQNTKILIIGLINEDPEKLTKLPIMRELFRERGIISGLLEDILYEQILKLRRLRGDLYFRMIRNGKVVIPDLRKRREDLPILFYTFLSRELGNKNLVIEYETFEELMDERIEWRGNIRELQTICKTVAQLLTKREQLSSGGYIVSRFKLRKALREHHLLEE